MRRIVQSKTDNDLMTIKTNKEFEKSELNQRHEAETPKPFVIKNVYQ